jgi:hypothetical protein
VPSVHAFFAKQLDPACSSEKDASPKFYYRANNDSLRARDEASKLGSQFCYGIICGGPLGNLHLECCFFCLEGCSRSGEFDLCGMTSAGKALVLDPESFYLSIGRGDLRLHERAVLSKDRLCLLDGVPPEIEKFSWNLGLDLFARQALSSSLMVVRLPC